MIYIMTMIVNDEEIQPRAFLHRKASSCVTTDPTAYENPIPLVSWEDIADHVDWLEKGVAEWRGLAIALQKELNRLRREQGVGMASGKDETESGIATWGVEKAESGDLLEHGSAPTAGCATGEATHHAVQHGQDAPVRFWVKQNGKTLVQGSLKGVTVSETPNSGRA